MTHRNRHVAKLHKDRHESQQRGERITELERALRPLQDLHAVSKLLTTFESVERTVPRVISLVAHSLALRSAVFLLGTTDTPLIIEWQPDGGDRDLIQTARAHATRTYEYLLRARSTVPEQGTDRTFVVLPLVVDHSIFGALQVEGTAPLNEQELMFVNAIANQLAITVDRAAAITAQRVTMETDERHQHVLADLGAGLIASSGLRDAFAALARSVVPRVADLCMIDGLHDDGAVERLSFATDTRLADRLQNCTRSPVASDRAMLMTDITSESSPLLDGVTEETMHLLRTAGATSLVVVPLVVRGRFLGAMTLAVGAGRHYSKRDLSFAVEVADRAAFGIDNIRLHEQTRHAADELRRAVQLREDVLAIVSHDLRGPLSAIHLSAEALHERHAHENPGSRKQLDTMRRAASRMEHLIDDLLDMASITTGSLSIDREPIVATKLVTETLDDLEPTATDKRVTIQRDLGNEEVSIYADPRRIVQVFGNLVGNAKKFCRDGDVIRVSLRVIDNVARFVVEDTGPGIPPSELPHLFEPYWSATRHKRQGTGLGLYICKGIVEAHGGRLWVESALGKGTKFFFTIPLA